MFFYTEYARSYVCGLGAADVSLCSFGVFFPFVKILLVFVACFFFSQELVKNVLVPAMTEMKNIPSDTLQFGKAKVTQTMGELTGHISVGKN